MHSRLKSRDTVVLYFCVEVGASGEQSCVCVCVCICVCVWQPCFILGAMPFFSCMDIQSLCSVFGRFLA